MKKALFLVALLLLFHQISGSDSAWLPLEPPERFGIFLPGASWQEGVQSQITSVSAGDKLYLYFDGSGKGIGAQEGMYSEISVSLYDYETGSKFVYRLNSGFEGLADANFWIPVTAGGVSYPDKRSFAVNAPDIPGKYWVYVQAKTSGGGWTKGGWTVPKVKVGLSYPSCAESNAVVSSDEKLCYGLLEIVSRESKPTPSSGPSESKSKAITFDSLHTSAEIPLSSFCGSKNCAVDFKLPSGGVKAALSGDPNSYASCISGAIDNSRGVLALSYDPLCQACGRAPLEIRSEKGISTVNINIPCSADVVVLMNSQMRVDAFKGARAPNSKLLSGLKNYLESVSALGPKSRLKKNALAYRVVEFTGQKENLKEELESLGLVYSSGVFSDLSSEVIVDSEIFDAWEKIKAGARPSYLILAGDWKYVYSQNFKYEHKVEERGVNYYTYSVYSYDSIYGAPAGKCGSSTYSYDGWPRQVCVEKPEISVIRVPLSVSSSGGLMNFDFFEKHGKPKSVSSPPALLSLSSEQMHSPGLQANAEWISRNAGIKESFYSVPVCPFQLDCGGDLPDENICRCNWENFNSFLKAVDGKSVYVQAHGAPDQLLGEHYISKSEYEGYYTIFSEPFLSHNKERFSGWPSIYLLESCSGAYIRDLSFQERILQGSSSGKSDAIVGFATRSKTVYALPRKSGLLADLFLEVKNNPQQWNSFDAEQAASLTLLGDGFIYIDANG